MTSDISKCLNEQVILMITIFTGDEINIFTVTSELTNWTSAVINYTGPTGPNSTCQLTKCENKKSLF